MGIHSTFSEKSKEGTKRTGLKNISSLIYKSISRVSYDKKTSKSVDSIEDRVDQILAKNKVISYQKSSKKGKFFKAYLLEWMYNRVSILL